MCNTSGRYNIHLMLIKIGGILNSTCELSAYFTGVYFSSGILENVTMNII